MKFYRAFKCQRRADNLARVHALSFDLEDALHAGEVRASLASAGTPIGPYDVLIAGQATARQLVLLTRNVHEFERVPGLFVDDWERE